MSDHPHHRHRSQDQDLHLAVDILQPQACLVSVRAGGRLHSELVFLFSSLVPGNLGVDVEWVMALDCATLRDRSKQNSLKSLIYLVLVEGA